MAQNPENIIVGAATVCVDGADLGFTTGGVTIRQESEYVENLADQFIGVVSKYRSLEKFFVATTMLEVTLTNLLLAFGYPNANLQNSTTLCLGYNSSCFINEHELAIKGPGPGCGCRTFVFTRAINVQTTVEYQMFRDQAVQLPVEFEILKDPDTGFFGCVYDGCTYQDSVTCA